MPTTLFYDDNCNNLVEYDGLPQYCWELAADKSHKTETSSPLLRALLTANVVCMGESRGQIQELTAEETNQMRTSYAFHEKMTRPSPNATPIQLTKYKWIANWAWELNDDINRHHVTTDTTRQSVALHPFCTQAACFETYACRSNHALKRNAITYWEIKMLANAGTSLMVGIGSGRAKLKSTGYLNLLGINENSWGLNINTGHVWHNNQHSSSTSLLIDEESETVIIGCLFDGYSGRLIFTVNGKSICLVPIETKINEPLYPMVSSTSANSQFRFERVCESMPTLQELCGIEITKSKLITDLQQQHILPYSLRNFLENY